jgi:GNAT superfamily N-acetyltransferase
MVIRPMAPDDRSDVLDLTREFLRLSPYEALFPPKPGHLDTLFDLTVTHGRVFVADDDGTLVGLIAGIVVPHGLTGNLYCEEVLWYVRAAARESGCGLQLLGALTEWATINGATMLKMLAPAESPVGHLLERHGFARVETAFMKLLSRPTTTEAVSFKG